MSLSVTKHDDGSVTVSCSHGCVTVALGGTITFGPSVPEAALEQQPTPNHYPKPESLVADGSIMLYPAGGGGVATYGSIGDAVADIVSVDGSDDIIAAVLQRANETTVSSKSMKFLWDGADILDVQQLHDTFQALGGGKGLLCEIYRSKPDIV